MSDELTRGSYLGRAFRVALRTVWPATVIFAAAVVGGVTATVVAGVIYLCVLVWRAILGG